MSRQRYSILPAQNEQGVWVYLFRDNDARNSKGGKLDYGVACHYNGEQRNFTKTLDSVEAIEICGDLNEQQTERDEEAAKEEALTRMALSIDKELRRNHIPPLRTGSGWGFWPFNR